MGLETATYIDALVATNPDGGDAAVTADDHIRLLKACLKRTFPMFGAAVSASAAAVSFVNDLSASVQAQLNALRDGSATANAALTARFANSAAEAAVAVAAGFAASASNAVKLNDLSAGRYLAHQTDYGSGRVWVRSDSASLALMADGDLWFRFT